MARRLIDWKTIRDEKIKRSRAWLFAELKKGRFPQPVVRGRGSNLWDEADVDRWLTEFVAASAQQAVARKVPAKSTAPRA